MRWDLWRIHLSERFRELLGWLLLLAVLIVNAVFLRYNAFRGFNFFDMGSFLDASWRIYRGQVPYVDFIFTTGPLHLYLNAFFFLLFGFGKNAVLAHLVTVSSIVIVSIFWMVRKYLPFWLCALLALLTAASFYWPISHPWYDQTAHLWGILAIVFLTTRLPETGGGKVFWTGACCGAMAVFSFVTKSNIGFIYGLLFFVILASFKERRKGIFGYGCGAVVALLISLVFIRAPAEYVTQAFLNYGTSQRARFIFFLWIPTWLMNYYWLPAAVVAINSKGVWRKYLRLELLLFGVYFVGLFSFLTGSMEKNANIPLWGPHMAIAFIFLSRVKREMTTSLRRTVWRLSFVFLVLLTGWMTVVAARYGYELKVWQPKTGSFFGDYTLQVQPLRGWKCAKGEGEFIDDIVQGFRSYVPEKDSFLVLTDLPILYSLMGRDSYRGIPFIFHQGVLPAMGKQWAQVRARITGNPPDWILIHSSQKAPSPLLYIVDYLDLDSFLRERYTPIKAWPTYILLRRKIDRGVKESGK